MELTEISGQSMRRNLSALGFASIAMIVLAAFFALLAGRRLAQPIQLLADHAERIGSGNYQQSLVIERSDEIGELATAFDKMRVNLMLAGACGVGACGGRACGGLAGSDHNNTDQFIESI